MYDPANYTPNTRDDITTLPSTGMPMAGKSATVNLTEKGSLTMQLKALMARIDINISIDSDHSDESGQLPPPFPLRNGACTTCLPPYP